MCFALCLAIFLIGGLAGMLCIGMLASRKIDYYGGRDYHFDLLMQDIKQWYDLQDEEDITGFPHYVFDEWANSKEE